MDILKDKVIKVFIHYSIPSVLGLLAISSASIIDGFFVGNYVGSVGLASINITFPVISILVGLAMMFASGNSVLVGKLLGEGKEYDASNLFSKNIFSVSLFSIFLCFLLYEYNHDNLFFYVSGELKELTEIYFGIVILFFPFLMVGVNLDYFAKVNEQPTLSLIALVSSAIINIFLDYLFIVIFNFGITGAAFATGISYIISFSILIIPFILRQRVLIIMRPKGSWLIVLSALKNGFSEFVNESSVGITALVFNIILIRSIGIEGVAAYTIVEYILLINIIVGFGISYALQPIISKHFGAKLPKRINRFMFAGFVSTFVFNLILALFVFLLPDEIVALFLKDKDFITIEISLSFLPYIWPALLFSGFSLTITGYLTAILKPVESAIIAIFRSLILPIFLVTSLSYIFDRNGIFMSIALSEAISACIAYYFYKKNRPNLLVV